MDSIITNSLTVFSTQTQVSEMQWKPTYLLDVEDGFYTELQINMKLLILKLLTKSKPLIQFIQFGVFIKHQK